MPAALPKQMRRLRSTVLLLAITYAGYGTIPDPKTLPAPPSVAINPSPLEANARIEMQVDAIPADAKYVIYAELKLDGLTIDNENVASVGQELSRILGDTFKLAKERGANLIVLLSNEHGIDVTISHCQQTLRLRPKDPVLTAILFQSKSLGSKRPEARKVRFTTTVPDAEGDRIRYKISLAQDTAGVTKAYWTYGNISRFVSDALEHDFDTIALQSTSDAQYENVSLPGCDDPLRISLGKPELIVTILKAGQLNQTTGPTSEIALPHAGPSVAPTPGSANR